MTFFVIGSDEDGAFIYEFETVKQLKEYVAESTTGDPDTIDMSKLEYTDNSWAFYDQHVYRTDYMEFLIIEGDRRLLSPKSLVTEIELV